MPQNTVNKKKSVRKNAKHPRASIGRGMLCVMLALGLTLAAFMIFVGPMLLTRAPETALIKIPQNASKDNVRDSLTKYFGDKFANRVMHMSRLRDVDFSHRHGAYSIPKGTNSLEAMRILTSGAQTPMRITVNGSRSLNDLLDHISDKLDMSADSLSMALFDSDILSKYGLDPESAMALFIDDTYEVYWSATPKQLLNKIGDNYSRLWNEENRKKAHDLGLTPQQTMILASIVQEETNNPGEQGTIGRLYINRLKKGMRLQADPTVRFAVGDFTLKRIKGDMLRYQSPYNTYIVKGLPPGPIRTPRKGTVLEILNSQPNEYLYMCAKEDFSGTHNFAKDFSTHTKNALRYQQALNTRGIK